MYSDAAGVGLGELHAAPVHPHLEEAVSILRFSSTHELVWAGTESGGLYVLQSPTLERYSSVRAHTSRVHDMVALGDGMVSVSSSVLRYHACGGLPRMTYRDDKACDMACCTLEPQGASRVAVGRQAGGLTVVDVASGRAAAQVETTQAVLCLAGPATRGLVVLGSPEGHISMLDPRSNYKEEHSVAAHPGGLAALDVRGDFVATCGFGTRMGQIVTDTYVKVFDVRMAPRVLGNIPFRAGPSMLCFHPKLSSTILVASTTGVFTLADVQGASFSRTYQVEAEGDAIVSAQISPSGEVMGFGGSGGYVHLWSATAEAHVNTFAQPLEAAVARPQPTVPLQEEDSFAAAPQYISMQGRLLSDFEPTAPVLCGHPPRVVDPSLLKDMKQVDFVGYLPNPKYRRGASKEEIARLVAPLRNLRQQPRQSAVDGADAKAARDRKRAESGLAVLPSRYRRMRIKQQTGVRFEDFDFSFHNRTRFAGLENDIANCYANALLQVLYFIPGIREALLRHVPDPDKEFSLACELSLLFRMLATAKGQACQATNLLRALRQNREAAALGLLEGHSQKGEGHADIEVEAGKDRSLERRIQSLQRFLLEQLHREGLAPAPSSGSKAGAAAPDTKAPPAADVTAITTVFGMPIKQRTQCLTGQKAEKLQDGPHLPGGPTVSTGPPRPRFGELLRQSLRAEGELRAWFDDKLGYQLMKQSRVPLSLPQTMAISCGLQDLANLAWWQPYTASLPSLGAPSNQAQVEGAAPEEATTSASEASSQAKQTPAAGRSFLPLALEIITSPESDEVKVREGESAAALEESYEDALDDASEVRRAVYELTAVVSSIHDADDQPSASSAEAHLVAHIKVLPQYVDTSRPSSASPRHPAASRAGSGALGSSPLSSAPRVPESLRIPDADAQLMAKLRRRYDRLELDNAVVDSLPDDLDDAFMDTSPTSRPPLDANDSGEASTSGRAHRPPLRLPASGSGRLGSGGLGGFARGSGRLGSGALPGTPSGPSFQNVLPGDWLLFNDFGISLTPDTEVCQLYDGQKVPCLLYYTKVEVSQADTDPTSVQPAPVLTPEAFRKLCLAPPLQNASVRLHRPSFTPLGPDELPKPGALFALDAEFVALCAPEKVIRSGVEVESRPSRLGLARVSVVRGEGAKSGVPCIDDYIRSTEQVYDYLTKYSGIVPGDLDPGMSPHHLTTMRRAYLKLRFLVDAGCVFVGHGLKKDFRMINIVVPPSQVIDTVDLFYLKRQRKLSLRFLSSYLLGQDIQQNTHDSIVDARTALRLYEVYQQLVEEGRCEEKLLEMYRWGKQTVKRFGKDVTHIIFQRTHQATAAEKLEDDSKLLQWYEKAAQDEVVVSIVSPLWVQQSLDEKRRAMEKPHILPKPKNILLNHKLTTRTPGSGHGTGRKAKRRRASPGPAKSQQPIDTGAAIFSSSQLIRGADLEAAGPANKHLSGALVDLDEVSSPAAKRRATAKKAPAHLQKQPKTGGSAAKRGRSAAFTVTQQAVGC
ncbi:hypothetical protein WJX72_010776 [[Myrmecia] bisecta]|uniref:Uncharacterized protein n=1 Tax=[Myrmecia] bisecta TaxID=41462 RepID=A0AAW1QGC8_9CHLO